MAPPTGVAPAETKLELPILDTKLEAPVLDGGAPSGTQLVQSCNFDREVQTYTLAGKDGTQTLQRILSVKPREGFRICGLTLNTHFADKAIGDGLVGGLNLPELLKGPDYSSFTGDLRLHFTPGAGLLLHTGFKAGDLSSDTAPGATGHSGLFYVGMDHFTKDQVANGFGFFDRSSYSIGMGWANLGNTTVGRLQLKSESDWIAYHHSGFRVAAQLFASETNISFGGGGDLENCKGNFCSPRDFYAPTTFYPLRLSLAYYFDAPSTSEDLYHAPGSRREISTEELTYKLSNRYFNEIVGQIRRENVARLIGARLAAGTSFQGVETSMELYQTAGSGMGVFGLMEGMDRGGNAYMLGDMMRNSQWWVILPEAGILLTYGLGSGLAQPLPTADEYWKGEMKAFGDFRGGAAKMGLITQGSQIGLTLLDGFGLLSDPQKGDAWFHASNGLLGALGFLGIWFARPIAGNGWGSGALANTVFRDTAPFFDGRSGPYDPIKENYPWTQQREYAVHSVGMMSLSYALNREFDWISGKFDKSAAYDEANPVAGKKTGSGPVVRVDLQLGPTGGMLGASGRF